MVAPPRPLYRHADLRRLIHPDSIVVYGASPRAGAFGLRTVANLSDFDGRVYPVNPNYPEVGGHKCYPSFEALPEAPDCVVIAVNRDLVEEAVAASVRAGAGGVIVYAGGFAETGRADLCALQERVLAQVAGTNTRLIGPNCLGITNYARGARIMFGRTPAIPRITRGGVGIVTQSGSVSMSLGQGVARGVAISHAIPIGNGGDVGIADMIAYLAEDEACSSIACIFEGVPDPHRLVEAARFALERDKPLIVYKMAVGQEGAAAALSHTGALAGAHDAYKAALEAAGVVMLDNLEDVLETSAFFAKARAPRGRGVAVVLGSGGLGVIAADKAEELGVAMPQPEGETLAVLKANVPEFGAARNPCDVTAMAMNDEGPLRKCTEALIADPVYSTLVVVQPYADAASSARIALWVDAAAKFGKVICNYWSTEALEGHGVREVEAEPNIATFRSLRRCYAAIKAWHARDDVRQALRTRTAQRLVDDTARAQAAALLRQHNRAALTEREAKEVLALYGIPVVSDAVVQDPAAAAAAATRIGYPVVVKVESPDILHKTEAGVLRVGLNTAAEVEAATRDILAAAHAIRPAPQIKGVLVQPMIPRGVEMMLGCRIDPQFGPLVVVGLGGVLVELLRDTALALAPVTPDDALRMLASLRTARILDGFRDLPAVDRARLAEIVARFSEFVADHAELLREVDVNPLICSGARVVAVDALIVRTEQ